MSRGLGSLTLDLIVEFGGFIEGWDKSERETKKRTKQLKKEVKELGDEFEKWGKRVILATVAATTALVVHTVKASREVGNLAQVANASAEEFQRYAVGAKQAGVEQQKLSDIFKDSNKNLGEFLRAGAGPMKDFFEQVAPKIGLTADQFRNLSGPQSLQLYFNSLQKANLSQSEMTFYLEKLASGSSKLIPLLRDGGAGFKLFADEAQRAGSILDSKTIEASDRLAAAFFLAENSAKGFKNQIAMGIMPTVVDLSSAFFDLSTDTQVTAGMTDILTGSMKFLAASAVGVVAAIDLTRKTIAALAASVSEIDVKWYDALFPVLLTKRIAESSEKIKNTFSLSLDDIKQTADEYGTLLNSIWAAGEGNEEALNQRIGNLAEMFKSMREASAGGAEGGDANAALQTEIDERLEILRQASMSELEILTQKRNQEFQFLLESRDQERILEDDYRALDLASEERYQKAKTDIQKREEAARKATLTTALGTISTLMNSENKKLFRVGQIAAISNATIAMFEGIGQALRLPWPLNMVIAPLVGAAGLANIANIKNTKFGGGGAGAAGVTPTQAVNAAATPAVPAGEQSRKIFIDGISPDSFFNGRQLMEILKATAKDGNSEVVFT